MELAVAPSLGALVAEHRTNRVQANRFGVHEKSVLDIGAEERRGCFRTEGQRFTTSILKRVHLFLDDVRGLADAPRKHFGPLEDRQPDFLVAIRLERSTSHSLDVLP